MGFWTKLLGREKESLKKTSSDDLLVREGKEHIPKFRDEAIPEALDLGWYFSEQKDEFQMAKIAEKDRAIHFYVIGATGTGKTKFLQFLIQQDIEKGNGFGVIDPHGDLIEDLKGFLALCYDPDDENIQERVILIDPTDPRFTVTFNPLEKLSNVSIPEQAGELISAFRKIWSDSWGVRMEDLMRNSLIALGEAELTLAELPSFLTDRSFRKGILERINHPVAIEYFKRFDVLTDRSQITWIEPVMNKINAFLSDERIRQIFSSNKSSFNLREIMDSRKILLVKLDKGKLKDSADLLGSLLMAKIQMAAFSRSDIPQTKRTPFYLYIDEFQNFASESFMVLLSEARKYGLSLIMAHQTLAQIPEELRSLILGNTGIQVYFRLNRHDSQLLSKEAFEYSGYGVKTYDLYRGPKFWNLSEEWEHYTEALQNLPPRVCFVKHKIEGGIIPIHTQEIRPVWEELMMDQEEYQDFIKTIPFGRKYLIERERLIELEAQKRKFFEERPKEKRLEVAAKKEEIKEPEKERIIPIRGKPEKVAQSEELLPEEKGFLDFIFRHPNMFVTQIYESLGLSGYKGDKLKESLIEKDLICQQETRDGKGGRLAKILVLTDKGLSFLKEKAPEGKGSDLHKHIQLMLKEQAEAFGWKAKIEEKIPRSPESVDIGLKKNDLKVAVEISATSKPDQEIENLRKCLEAGYDYVISVSSDEKQVSLIKQEAKRIFSFKERERLRFCHISRFKNVLLSIGGGIVSENGIVSEQISKEKQLVDVNEAAEFLGISKHTLYEWVLQGKIPYHKVGRLLKFKREDLSSWLEKRKMEEKKDLVL